MKRIRIGLTRLRGDANGSVVIEFAILAPVLIAMMMGVLTMGLHMFSANALQSVGSDTARYTVVEYQKFNKLTDEQIQSKAYAIAVNRPYGLDFDRLDVTVSRPATDISGTIKFQVQSTYTPFNPLAFAGIGSPTITNTRLFYVSST